VFFARFIFGMRVIAGPLAGVLRMDWERFATFNVLGAATWVVTVSSLGYIFGQHWEQLLLLFRRVSVLLGLLTATVVVWLWWRYGKGYTGRAR
jgi:membrane-associated protein